MKRVFIDTNIYLAFYEVSKDDLEKLSEAFNLAAEQEIKFVTTTQVKNEFLRRRNSIVAESLKKFSEIRIPGLPAMAKGIAEMEAYIEARKAMSMSHKALLDSLNQNAIGDGLDADKAVRRLFEVSEEIELSAACSSRAISRVDLGNPPGKRGSLGDAINWECLLGYEDQQGDLIIVSQDKDFRDPLKRDEINDFLAAEWRSHHDGDIFLFQSLSEFISCYFSEVDIKSFAKVDEKITALAGSGSFADTHVAIAELTSVSYFTRRQALRLVHVLDGNDQVNWIFKDEDVNSFYRNLLDNCRDKLDVNEVSYLEELIAYDGDGPYPIFHIPF